MGTQAEVRVRSVRLVSETRADQKFECAAITAMARKIESKLRTQLNLQFAPFTYLNQTLEETHYVSGS